MKIYATETNGTETKMPAWLKMLSIVCLVLFPAFVPAAASTTIMRETTDWAVSREDKSCALAWAAESGDMFSIQFSPEDAFFVISTARLAPDAPDRLEIDASFDTPLRETERIIFGSVPAENGRHFVATPLSEALLAKIRTASRMTFATEGFEASVNGVANQAEAFRTLDDCGKVIDALTIEEPATVNPSLASRNKTGDAIAAQLVANAEVINRRMPLQLDEWTKMVGVSTAGRLLINHYEVSPGIPNDDNFRKFVLETGVANTCRDPALLRVMKNYGVTFRFSYKFVSTEAPAIVDATYPVCKSLGLGG